MLLPQSLSAKRGSSIQLVRPSTTPPSLRQPSQAGERNRGGGGGAGGGGLASPPHFARSQSVLRRTPRASPPERHGRRLSVMSPPQSPSLTARFLRGEDSIVLASCSSPEPISASRGCSIGFEAERGQAPAELVAELGRAQQMYLRGSALLFSFRFPSPSFSFLRSSLPPALLVPQKAHAQLRLLSRSAAFLWEGARASLLCLFSRRGTGAAKSKYPST